MHLRIFSLIFQIFPSPSKGMVSLESICTLIIEWNMLGMSIKRYLYILSLNEQYSLFQRLVDYMSTALKEMKDDG